MSFVCRLFVDVMTQLRYIFLFDCVYLFRLLSSFVYVSEVFFLSCYYKRKQLRIQNDKVIFFLYKILSFSLCVWLMFMFLRFFSEFLFFLPSSYSTSSSSFHISFWFAFIFIDCFFVGFVCSVRFVCLECDVFVCVFSYLFWFDFLFACFVRYNSNNFFFLLPFDCVCPHAPQVRVHCWQNKSQTEATKQVIKQ